MGCVLPPLRGCGAAVNFRFCGATEVAPFQNRRESRFSAGCELVLFPFVAAFPFVVRRLAGLGGDKSLIILTRVL